MCGRPRRHRASRRNKLRPVHGVGVFKNLEGDAIHSGIGWALIGPGLFDMSRFGTGYDEWATALARQS